MKVWKRFYRYWNEHKDAFGEGEGLTYEAGVHFDKMATIISTQVIYLYPKQKVVWQLSTTFNLVSQDNGGFGAEQRHLCQLGALLRDLVTAQGNCEYQGTTSQVPR
jgi:hypothetical protein